MPSPGRDDDGNDNTDELVLRYGKKAKPLLRSGLGFNSRLDRNFEFLPRTAIKGDGGA